MILSDGSMLGIHGHGSKDFRYHGITPIIIPYDPCLQQPASYDLLLGSILADEPWSGDIYILKTHEFILGSTTEFVNIPNNMVARIEGKSSLARQGLMVHTAGFIDPGFQGQLTLEIVNHGKPFPLEKGMKIAQLALQTMDAAALRPYGHPELGSHYQGQLGPTPAR
jgi:dCTP deaminase